MTFNSKYPQSEHLPATMYNMMKALIVTELGKPTTLVDVPIPEPKENEVLVKMKVASISPHNQYSRDTGLFIGEHLPQGLFQDKAGIVTQLGPDVTKYAVGDRVIDQGFFMGESVGSQEYSIVNTQLSAKIPDSVSLDGAATLPVNAMAAFACLFHEKGLNIPAPFSGFDSAKSSTFPYSSTTVLIIGAGSAAGKLGVRFASMAHIGRIIAVASSKNEAELKSLGATDVVDRNSSNLVQDIRKLVSDDLIYVVDNVNGGDSGLDLAVQTLSNTKKGRAVSLLPSSASETVSAAKPAGYEGVFMLAASRMLGDLAVQFWSVVPEWLANGDIKTFPFQIIEGLDVGKINGVLDRYRDGEGVAPKVNIHI